MSKSPTDGYEALRRTPEEAFESAEREWREMCRDALPAMMARDPEFCQAVVKKALPSIRKTNALIARLKKKGKIDFPK